MKPRKKRKSSQSNIPFIAASLIVGAACGLMIASVCFDDDLSFGQFMIRLGIGIIVMYLAAIVQIIIHEGGHLLFGLMSGYKFVSFRVLSFMLVRVDGKMQFKRMSIAGTGGQCLLDPPDMVDGRLPYVAYNLGGVILNLVTAAIFGAIAPALRGHDLAFLVFCMLAVIGVAFAVLNGLPIASAMSNDGNNARSLGKDPEALRSFWLQMKINALSCKGVRLRDMPKEWFELSPDADLGNIMVAVEAVLRENRLMDEHRFDEAAEYIDKLRSMKTAILPLHMCMLICDRMYCALLHGEDAAKFRTPQQLKLMKSLKTQLTIIRTEYAWALLSERDEQQAEQLRKRFDHAARSYPSPADIASELELIDLLEEQNG